MKYSLFILLFYFISFYSNACSCVIPPLEKKYEQADFVADITVIKVYKNKGDEELYKADIKINHLYKGESIKSIQVYGRSDGKPGSTCSIFIPEGARLIAYSNSNENSYYLGICSGFMYIDHPSKSEKNHYNSKNYKEKLAKEFKYIENQTKAHIPTKEKDYSKNVASLDSIIKTLYSVISGEKGEKRDWELFKYLFYKKAKLIPTGTDKEGKTAIRYMSPEDYIKSSGKWLEENGFHEVEMNRQTQTFGKITHVFSTYESFQSKTDEASFMRGINSIQLLNDGKRWWIINIYWMQESEENPIPDYYLSQD